MRKHHHDPRPARLQATAEPKAKPATGYHVTPHISKYYDKARF